MEVLKECLNNDVMPPLPLINARKWLGTLVDFFAKAGSLPYIYLQNDYIFTIQLHTDQDDQNYGDYGEGAISAHTQITHSFYYYEGQLSQ